MSKTAAVLAGFEEIEADKLRKVIAKKAGIKLVAYEKQFFDGCRRNGVTDDVIQKIWDMMLSFDRYSFCKPHSASYAMVSFQSAYLRVHHPAEFMVAVLSNQALGFLRKLHPLALWKDKVVVVQRIKAVHIGGYLGRYVCLVGWQVTQKEVWAKDGLTMSFLTFEDETAIYETVIFPKVYDQYNRLLFDQRPFLVYGRVTEDNGAVSLEVTRIELLSERN
ncbi:DNA polymerase III subunit alpha [Treponema primitia ZAS-2]|uniref:DNA polymerase III subunit alpha n=1 Tax=Treponema primitia (strain ATCC BAA-887 / DSM 12427 / ZAS-2) TaxID=545694 RepID=F5YKC6_TREPZ|nr:OB-fold nucleic acid binding domain-containing protein [Treponema primitia]AEF86050.1 DNA polymerase III subunit alpha [Treponema primitia ZAS-2]